MKRLTVLQLARKYLPVIPLRRGQPYPDYSEGFGIEPDCAALVSVRGVVSIYYYRRTDYCDEVLHELCHALCGPKSLGDESALMALQWALMQKLTPRDYKRCRKKFTNYSIGNGFSTIGAYDDFIHTIAWQRYEQRAFRQGLLTKTGKPSRSLKVQPKPWARQLRRQGGS